LKLLALFALAGALMLTNASFRRRQIMRSVSERVEGTSRYVDCSVLVKTVVADPDGDELVPDKPRLRVIAVRAMGGIADTKCNPPRLTGFSQSPRVWYCSPEQAEALFHNDPSKLAQLIYGSEGAGKTRLLAMWHARMWLLHFGDLREGGQTAPTETRLEFVREEMFQLFPANWFKYQSANRRFVMCDGTRIQLVSTYRQSKAQGSPIQGFNWSWCGRDEAQDSIDVHEDIESRGRAARVVNGIVMYWQMATATAKDDSGWRELRDRLVAAAGWIRRELSIFRSPFVARSFIENKAQTLSRREFLRRYGDPATGAIGDLPPELAVYYGWERARNLLELPQIAKDVTQAVLGGYRSYLHRNRAFGLLCAHDPGNIYNTTVVIRMLMFGNVPTWCVVGELQTTQTTQREHAAALVKYLRDSFYVNHPTIDGPLALTFVDPHGKGEAQTDYDSVYGAFQKEGLDVFNPAGIAARIKRRARIEMMNRLLGGTMNGAIARLVVCKDSRGAVLAPRLVEAFESLKKKPGDDDPEGSQRKDEADKTHAPAAASYGLWMFEQEATTENTVRVALAAANGR
jgi:hypothetical protein